MSLRWPLALSLAFQALLFPQTRLKPLAQPPVPVDPSELVAGAAHPVENAEQRQAAVNLLEKARSLSNLRAQPYTLSTTFTASDGDWMLEDTSPSSGVYRWTAQGPGYSALNLYVDKVLYSNQPAVAVPLRLAQVRTAVFFMYRRIGPQSALRTANANLNGTGLSCILLNHGMKARLETGGRGWDETEYCINPATGLLSTYSPAPGLFVVYDYSNAIHYHGKVMPGAFTITEGGQTVVQARIDSVTEPTAKDPAQFDPGSMNRIGVGSLMTPPWYVSIRQSQSSNPKSLHVVLLHAMLSPQGELTETTVLATTDAALNQAALAKAAAWRDQPSEGDDAEPGATPQSHELFFTVQFAR